MESPAATDTRHIAHISYYRDMRCARARRNHFRRREAGSASNIPRRVGYVTKQKPPCHSGRWRKETYRGGRRGPLIEERTVRNRVARARRKRERKKKARTQGGVRLSGRKSRSRRASRDRVNARAQGPLFRAAEATPAMARACACSALPARTGGPQRFFSCADLELECWLCRALVAARCVCIELIADHCLYNDTKKYYGEVNRNLLSPLRERCRSNRLSARNKPTFFNWKTRDYDSRKNRGIQKGTSHLHFLRGKHSPRNKY